MPVGCRQELEGAGSDVECALPFDKQLLIYTLGIKQNISFRSSSKIRCLNKMFLKIVSERVLLGNVSANLSLPCSVQYLSTCSCCHCDIEYV